MWPDRPSAPPIAYTASLTRLVSRGKNRVKKAEHITTGGAPSFGHCSTRIIIYWSLLRYTNLDAPRLGKPNLKSGVWPLAPRACLEAGGDRLHTTSTRSVHSVHSRHCCFDALPHRSATELGLTDLACCSASSRCMPILQASVASVAETIGSFQNAALSSLSGVPDIRSLYYWSVVSFHQCTGMGEFHTKQRQESWEIYTYVESLIEHLLEHFKSDIERGGRSFDGCTFTLYKSKRAREDFNSCASTNRCATHNLGRSGASLNNPQRIARRPFHNTSQRSWHSTRFEQR